jgi:hypothetical protein
MSDEFDYDRENVVEEIHGLAKTRLSAPVTLKLVAWDGGDFQVVAFHSIEATYPDEEEEEERWVAVDGLPFYRERLMFSTTGDVEGWILHEVVRRRCGRTGAEPIWTEQVGGYTPNWPKPIEDDEDDEGDDEDGPTYPGSTFPGRFA